MTRTEIITRARHLLNETTDGFWDIDELYKYGTGGERDLIMRLPAQHINNLLKRQQINYDSGVGPLCYAGLNEGKLFVMPDDFLRLQHITDKVNYKFATLVDFGSLYYYQDSSYAIPTNRKPICFFCAEGTPSVSGLAIVPCETNNADVYYYRDCAAWADGNKDEDPEVGDSGHTLLIDYICKRALEKDHEDLMGQFEKNYENGIKALGGK